jgi:hypothetical protein
MSGLLNGYAGIFFKESWRARNLDAVRANPPSLLVCDRDFLDGNPDAVFRKYNPELYAWLRAHYSRVVFEADGLVVCIPSTPDY